MSRNTVRRCLRVQETEEKKLGAVEVMLAQALSTARVENVLARLNATPASANVETSFQLKDAPRADTRHYNSLCCHIEVGSQALAVHHV